jgi:putative ABC transport system permease protein
MIMGRQILVLLQMNLGGVKAWLGPALVVVLGTACVVGVLISTLSIGASFRLWGTKGTRPDRLIVTTPGDSGGAIKRDTVLALSDLEGVKRSADSKPLVSGVMFGFAEGRKRIDGVRVLYGVRGVEPGFLGMVPELRVVDGRMFRPGLHEVIVGIKRQAATIGLELGDRIRMGGVDWLVVGHYESIQYLDDGALTDADTLMSVLKMDTFAFVEVMLDSAPDLERFKHAIKTNTVLNVSAESEDKFMARQLKQFTQLIDFISYFISSIMAIGATVGAVNIMYMIVDRRRREMATLRAIGFASYTITVAVLLESLLIALPGAALGAGGAWLMFNGHHVTPFGFSVNLTVTANVVGIGIGWAFAMGLVGGLSPAIRAAGTPVAEALRAV